MSARDNLYWNMELDDRSREDIHVHVHVQQAYIYMYMYVGLHVCMYMYLGKPTCEAQYIIPPRTRMCEDGDSVQHSGNTRGKSSLLFAVTPCTLHHLIRFEGLHGRDTK